MSGEVSQPDMKFKITLQKEKFEFDIRTQIYRQDYAVYWQF